MSSFLANGDEEKAMSVHLELPTSHQAAGGRDMESEKARKANLPI